MYCIQDCNFKDKKALIRVDFNVPLDSQGAIIDTARIDRTLPTIRKVLTDGGAAILISHLGRPQGSYTATLSLQPLVPYLAAQLGTQVHFAADCIGPATIEKARSLPQGHVLLLENVRFHAAEENNDPAFAQALADLGHVYINDAFGTLHRQHASTHQITHYTAANLAGYLLQAEIDSANRLLRGYTKPFTVILGGTKVADKLSAIEALLDKIDHLLIGGVVANTFQQALGGQLGNSMLEPKQVDTALTILNQAIEKGVNIVLPTDVVIADQLDGQGRMRIASSQHIPPGWMAVDLGPYSQTLFKDIIRTAATILWTGPIGLFEVPAFSQGTQAIIQEVASATQSGAFSLIGGGDSATAIAQFGYTDQMSFISTGGGALLAYLAQPQLPALTVLNRPHT